MKKLFAVFAFMAVLILASCGGHVCDFKEEWSQNGDKHWKSCSHIECDERAALADHSFGEPRIEKVPTEAEEGKLIKSCEVCGYESSSTVPRLEHVHSLGDEPLCDYQNHWYSCAGCGERVGVAPHGRGEASVITEPTNDTPGEARYVCPDCGYSYTEPIPPLPRTLTEEEWRAAFGLDNLRIEHTYHMGSIPQKESFEVDGELILADTGTKFYIKNTGMSVFPGLDFADRYYSFVHREGGVFTADKITVGNEALTYNFANVRLTIVGGRLTEVTYTVIFDSLLGRIDHRYVLGSWGEVELKPDRLTEDELDAMLEYELFAGNITVRVTEMMGDSYTETEHSVAGDVCIVKTFDENGRVTESHSIPSEGVGVYFVNWVADILDLFDVQCFIADPDGGDSTGALEYGYSGPSVKIMGFGNVGSAAIVARDGRISSFYFEDLSGELSVIYSFDYGEVNE